jgi:hypothetical protein
MFNPPPPNPPTFPLTTVDPVTGQTVKRQVIIVYIPTTSLDAKFEAVQNLACAFGATQERTNFDKPFLEVFAPTDPDFLSLEPSCVTMSSANEATCFYKYWQYLLNGPPVGSTVSPEYNIVKFAERDFKERLTKTSIKY